MQDMQNQAIGALMLWTFSLANKNPWEVKEGIVRLDFYKLKWL